MGQKRPVMQKMSLGTGGGCALRCIDTKNFTLPLVGIPVTCLCDCFIGQFRITNLASVRGRSARIEPFSHFNEPASWCS